MPRSPPPRLPAKHTHARSIDADETPCCPFLKQGQGAYKYVCVGAVGVPVATVNAQTAWTACLGGLFAAPSPCLPPVYSPGASVCGGSAGGLVEELLLHHVVDCNVGQNCHLVPRNVRGSCQVAHPGIYAFTHRVLPAVHGVWACFAPHPHTPRSFHVIALIFRGVVRRRHLAEDNAGRGAIAPFGEELGVHRWNGRARGVHEGGAPVVSMRGRPMGSFGPVVAGPAVLLWRTVFGNLVPCRGLLLSCSVIGCRLLSYAVVGCPSAPGQSTSHVHYSLDANQKEQDQWWRPHGQTSWAKHKWEMEWTLTYKAFTLKLVRPRKLLSIVKKVHFGARFVSAAVNWVFRNLGSSAGNSSFPVGVSFKVLKYLWNVSCWSESPCGL